jgi:hypothetical protein
MTSDRLIGSFKDQSAAAFKGFRENFWKMFLQGPAVFGLDVTPAPPS